MNKFGSILKEIRLERGVTQKQLANFLNVTDRSIRDWENEGIQPNYEILVQISDYFAVSLDYLLGRENY